MSRHEPTRRDTWLAVRRTYERIVRQEPGYAPWLAAVDWGLREGAADSLWARNAHHALIVYNSDGSVVVDADPAGAAFRVRREALVLLRTTPLEHLVTEFVRSVGSLLEPQNAARPDDLEGQREWRNVV